MPTRRGRCRVTPTKTGSSAAKSRAARRPISSRTAIGFALRVLRICSRRTDSCGRGQGAVATHPQFLCRWHGRLAPQSTVMLGSNRSSRFGNPPHASLWLADLPRRQLLRDVGRGDGRRFCAARVTSRTNFAKCRRRWPGILVTPSEGGKAGLVCQPKSSRQSNLVQIARLSRELGPQSFPQIYDVYHQIQFGLLMRY